MGRTSDSKDRILTAGRDLIWKQGYCAVTIDAICEEAGVRKGSFYHFFDSKSDVATAAFEELWDEVRPKLDQIFALDVPPLDRLQNYFRFLYESQLELKRKYGCVVGCPFGSVGSELSQREEPVCRNARAILASYRKYFETALRDAEAEGAIETRSIPAAARRLSAYMEGCLLQARVQNNLGQLRDLATNALDFIGVSAPPGPKLKRNSHFPRPRIAAAAGV